MIRADARLRVVLVNYNGGDLLERAVRSALTSQWPGEVDVVVVDNASTDDSLAAIEELAGVHVIHNETNEGFSANNHGLADLIGDEFALQLPEPDVVALLNPDAVVRPEAFRRLAGVLDVDKLIGVASPTILFDRPFIECHILAGDDPLVISHIRCGDDDLASQCHGVNGAERFPGPDGPVWHCPHRSILRVPVAALGAQLELGIERGEGVIDGESVEPGMVYTSPVAARPSLRIVQNAGVRIDSAGVGHSRGFAKRVEEPLGADAALWTGAAAVFHADYFRTVGGFDPEYFLYYEDVELGLRGLANGWKTAHVPDAIVEHRHSDRTVQGSELVEVLQHKNRLLTQVRHGSKADVAKTFGRAALTPVSLAASALRSPGERNERLRLAKWRAKALRDAVKGLPEAREARDLIDEGRTVDPDEVQRIARRER